MQVTVAVITFLGVVVTAFFGYFGTRDSGTDATSPRTSTTAQGAGTPTATREVPSPAAPSQTDSFTPTASASPSTPSGSPQTYTAVYQDKPMAISMGDWRRGVIDFDVPSVRNFSSSEWASLPNSDEWDLRYWGTSVTGSGYLEVSDNVSAAQLTDLPASADECASEAQIGGYSEAHLEDWPLKAGNGLCLVTDRGNLVRLKIIDFVGGNSRRGDAPPDRVEFEATMWQGGTS